MIINTESIIDIVESSLNKKITDIDSRDLDNIKYLRVCKTRLGDILNVDFSELKYFINLEELSIEGCMIDYSVLDIIKELLNLQKISFIDCDFVDDPREYFENLYIEELVLNNVIGIEGNLFSNITKLTIVNIPINFNVQNINTFDISHANFSKTNLIELGIENLIINVKQLTEEYLNLPYIVIVKNNFDEIVKVIKHD